MKSEANWRVADWYAKHRASGVRCLRDDECYTYRAQKSSKRTEDPPWVWTPDLCRVLFSLSTLIYYNPFQMSIVKSEKIRWIFSHSWTLTLVVDMTILKYRQQNQSLTEKEQLCYIYSSCIQWILFTNQTKRIDILSIQVLKDFKKT
jgi:hypothetical protein